MADVDQIVELKIKQHNTEQRLDAMADERRADKEANDLRFDSMERLLDEQNRMLGGLNVTLSKLSVSFETVMTKADKWVQRVLGGAVVLSVSWALFSDDPISKISWLWGLIS